MECAETKNTDKACCGPAANENIKYKPIALIGGRITTDWRLSDYIGAIAVRLNINRMDYAVKPGLYRVGNPGKNSPVLVSANYKLSFDVLRRELAGVDAWLLVLDTKGVNVWCAAGKGTFGTAELVKQIAGTKLAEVVTSRTVILPQLGAPGVSAQMVSAFSGFSVKYGPVRASDIKKYLSAGMKADAAMRRVTFGAWDRVAVSWTELVPAAWKGLIITIGLIIINIFFPSRILLIILATFWVAILSGTLFTALLLPYLPFKAFSAKGGILGGIVTAGFLTACNRYSLLYIPPVSVAALTILMTAVSAFLALNYTGCSTYTSPSGVKKEIRLAMPVIISLVVIAGVLTYIGRMI